MSESATHYMRLGTSMRKTITAAEYNRLNPRIKPKYVPIYDPHKAYPRPPGKNPPKRKRNVDDSSS